MDQRQHALEEIDHLFAASAQRVDAAAAELVQARKRVEAIFTAGLCASLGMGLAFLTHSSWWFFGFFFALGFLWTLHSVFHHLMARKALQAGVMAGAHREMGIWKEAVRKAKDVESPDGSK